MIRQQLRVTEGMEDGEHSCFQCDKTFDTREALDGHVSWHGGYPKEAISEEIRRVAEELDRPPTPEEINRLSSFSAQTVLNKFGSWADARESAGLPRHPEFRDTISAEELIAEIKRLATEFDRPPTLPEWKEMAKYSNSPVERVFGRWGSALNAAGFQPHNPSTLDRDQLLAELRALADELEHTPTQADMNERGPFSEKPYRQKFGSWNAALQAAGLETNIDHDVSKSELVEAIQSVAGGMGEAPTLQDFNRRSEFSPTPIYRAFDSWNDALREAGFEPNFERCGPVLCECTNCGSIVEKKRANARRYYNHFCSQNCHHEWLAESGAPSGPDHPLWMGGRNLYYPVLKNLPERRWDDISNELREDECQKCGRAEDPTVHYIIPVLAGGMNESWNAMTLCRSCHTTVEFYTRKFTSRVLVPDELGDRS